MSKTATAATATATAAPTEAPEEEVKPAAKTKAAKPEPKVHPRLLEVVKNYDSNIQAAETYYIEMIEIVQNDNISRSDVVATLMKARGIAYESAQSEYSRMKGIFGNKEVLEQLKAGEITLRMAREKTKKTQKNPASAKAGATETNPAKKEERFQKAVTALVASAKECGFDGKSVITTVTAELKAAGIA